MPFIQTFDLPFSSSTSKMLAEPSKFPALNARTTRSISMSTRSPFSTLAAIPLYPRTQAVEALAEDRHDQPSAFRCWLNNYFRATPEERMEDRYNAYRN
jgi:hypothetical protein